MKRRTNVRRANYKRRERLYGVCGSAGSSKPKKSSKKKPKTPVLSNKQKTHAALKKAGLSTTKTRRRTMHTKMEGAVEYKIPKLSNIVGKPSRYRVKKRIINYKVEHRQEPQTVWRGKHYRRKFPWSIPTVVPGQYVEKMVDILVKKKAIRERLVVKRLGKKGQGKGGSGGERVSHKTGSAAAKRSRAKSRGMKVQKEAKKEKSRKKRR